MRKRTGKSSTSRSKGVNPVLQVAPANLAFAYLARTVRLNEHVGPFLAGILEDFSSGRTREAFARLPDPTEYSSDLTLFQEYRQFLAFFTKCVVRGNIDPRKEALASWERGEEDCRRTNKRIRAWRRFPLETEKRFPLYDRLLNWSREYIRRTIGEFTPRKYERILDLSRPGPGIAIGSHDRTRTSSVYKYTHTVPVCYPKTVPIARDWFLRNPSLIGRMAVKQGSRYGVSVVNHNRTTFVPKSAKTLRTIAVEGSLSVMIQLGVHEFLRELFVRKDVCDLGSQERNQLLAYLASRDSGLTSLSTLDLANASNSVSTELIRYLLPESWFHFLDALRAPATLLNGESRDLEMFSSMGNGYTFALETLVFKALSEAVRHYCGGELTAVYGDDIIVPTNCALLLTELLEHVGFKVNTEKSFYLGPFKESCGADWHNGVSVTPVYVRQGRIRATDAYRILNTLPRSSASAGVRGILLRSLGRETIRGPVNEDSSSCLFVDSDLHMLPNSRWNAAIQNWEFKVLVQQGVEHSEPEEVAYSSALLLGGRSLPFRGVSKTRTVWKSAGRVIPAYGWLPSG